jgi:hypothetical protein
MAIVNNGTKNSLTPNELPSGYIRPTVTTFADYEYSRTLTLNVLKATVEAATGAATMAAIIANATVGITKQIDAILAADYLATATVTAYADLVGLTHNIASINGAGDYLKNTAVSYVCTVNLYVKTS